jgi:hypothetical protein
MNNSIQLQGIGRFQAKTGAEIRVGDTLVWNYGGTSVVEAIVRETASFVVILERYDGDKTYQRKIGKNRLVAFSSK